MSSLNTVVSIIIDGLMEDTDKALALGYTNSNSN